MEFVNNHKNTINDKLLEQWSDELTKGNIENDKVISSGYGKPYNPIKVENTTVSFTISKPMKDRIVDFAKQNNCTTSDFIRAALMDKMISSK